MKQDAWPRARGVTDQVSYSKKIFMRRRGELVTGRVVFSAVHGVHVHLVDRIEKKTKKHYFVFE